MEQTVERQYLITESELNTLIAYIGERPLKETLQLWVILNQQVGSRLATNTSPSKVNDIVVAES